MTDELGGLDPAITHLLTAERERAEVTPADRRRAFARLEKAILAGAAGGHGGGSSGGADPASGGVAGATTAASGSGGVIALLGLAIGGATMVAILVAEAPSPVTESRGARLSASPGSAASASEPVAVISPSNAAVPAPVISVTELADVPAPAAVSAASSPPAPSLARERSLLDAARGAIAQGDGARAMASLDTHAASFPSGRLSEEREALAVHALVLLHRDDAARRRAARFHQKFPASVLARAVDAAVRSIP